MTDEDAWAEKMVTLAENGDWRDVLRSVARRSAADTVMVGHLIRDMQACYAAGVLHSPTECLTWLENTLSGPGNLPEGHRPDPAWFGEGWGRAEAGRPIPENCATINQPASAPPTNPRAGFTGMGPRAAQAEDGRWWTSTSGGVYMVAFPEQIPGASVLTLDVDMWLAGQNAGHVAPVEWWRPADLPWHLDLMVTQPGGDRQHVAFTTVDGLGYVDAAYLRWIQSNLVDLEEKWVVEQVGGGQGPLRWTDPDGLAWAYLMPVKFTDEPSCSFLALTYLAPSSR